MSASTIARWNAISLERPDSNNTRKRSRSVDPNEDDDDDISLVSRSPSPQPDGDSKTATGTEWYDEHVKGVAREVVTVETKLKSSNIGFALLKKMGWSEGQGLGMTGEGRPDPIPFVVKYDSTGIGKYTQDFEVIESTVASRRGLDSERQIKETQEQRARREAQVAQKEAIKTEVFATLRPFYCDVCDKQYANVSQYDEHVRGYAHTHKVRMKEMTASVRANTTDIEKRKEKERKREEKEMRKLAKAAGIKLAPLAKASAPSTGPSTPIPAEPAKSGWAPAIGDAPPVKSGWSTVGTLASATPDNASAGPSSAVSSKWSLIEKGSTGKQTFTGSTTLTPVVVHPETPTTPRSGGFVSAGFTRLETSSQRPASPMQIDLPSTATRPGSGRPAQGGWAPVSLSSGSNPPPPPSIPPPPPPPSDFPAQPPVAPEQPPPRTQQGRPSFQARQTHNIEYRYDGPLHPRGGWNDRGPQAYGERRPSPSYDEYHGERRLDDRDAYQRGNQDDPRYRRGGGRPYGGDNAGRGSRHYDDRDYRRYDNRRW